MFDKNAKSIISLFNEMVKALNANDDSYRWLLSICDNQSSLANAERKCIYINSMALNTFKKYSNQYIDGGFKEVNKVRVALKNKRRGGYKKVKVDLRSDIKTLKQKLEDAERTRAVLIRAYADLNSITLDALSGDSIFNSEYLRHQELYSKYFGLSVVSINDEK